MLKEVTLKSMSHYFAKFLPNQNYTAVHTHPTSVWMKRRDQNRTPPAMEHGSLDQHFLSLGEWASMEPSPLHYLRDYSVQELLAAATKRYVRNPPAKWSPQDPRFPGECDADREITFSYAELCLAYTFHKRYMLSHRLRTYTQQFTMRWHDARMRLIVEMCNAADALM